MICDLHLNELFTGYTMHEQTCIVSIRDTDKFNINFY